MKKTIAVFFGGQACEHDISIVTSHQMMENINRKRFHVVPIYISREGQWYSGEKLLDMDFMRRFDSEEKSLQRVWISPMPNGRKLLSETKKSGLFGKKEEPIIIDAAIIGMHGLNGEDGTLQGVLELADIPYTSSGVLGSAVGMDKVMMKAAFRGADIPALPGVCVLRDEWEANPDQAIAKIEKDFQYPLMVKPANLGSSIGISRAEDRDGLYEAMEVAVQYDRRILVEPAVQEMAEYNCSAMGFSEDIRVSVCEQPVSWQSFLTFEEKYLRDSSGKNAGMEGMGRILPAPIDDTLTAQIQALSGKIFRLFDCKGVVRIDFIYDKASQQIYANEINTIPGSFAFYLWEPLGISFEQLIDQLIQLAEEAHREKKRNVFAYDSNVLKKNYFGSKGSK